MYIADSHSKFKIIPHGQQSVDHTIVGLVNVRHSFQAKTAIKRDINKPLKQLTEIWCPFLKSSETFRVDLA